MLASEFLSLIEMLVSHAPSITTSTVKLYSDVAHGEGGLAKVQKAVNDLAGVVNSAVTGS